MSYRQSGWSEIYPGLLYTVQVGLGHPLANAAREEHTIVTTVINKEYIMSKDKGKKEVKKLKKLKKPKAE